MAEYTEGEWGVKHLYSLRVNLITQIKLTCENTNAVAGASVTGN